MGVFLIFVCIVAVAAFFLITGLICDKIYYRNQCSDHCGFVVFFKDVFNSGWNIFILIFGGICLLITIILGGIAISYQCNSQYHIDAFEEKYRSTLYENYVLGDFENGKYKQDLNNVCTLPFDYHFEKRYINDINAEIRSTKRHRNNLWINWYYIAEIGDYEPIVLANFKWDYQKVNINETDPQT